MTVLRHRVGEDLVVPEQTRVIILAVEGGRVSLGLTRLSSASRSGLPEEVTGLPGATRDSGTTSLPNGS
jgi:hypothetical protein